MELVFFFILLPVTHSVKHYLTYLVTTSSGLQTFPELVAVSVFDGVEVGYCDSDHKRAEPRQDWIQKLIQDDPQHSEWHTQTCVAAHQDLKAHIEGFKQHLNQTGGVHVFQEMSTCEWDDETEEEDGFQNYGYNGEDFVSFEMKTRQWMFTENAANFTHKWDRNKARLDFNKIFFTIDCPQWLKTYVIYGRSSMERKVSLLQKTPSSPVSCHATGFYPDRAEMFWRKDGEQLHEDVDRGEILHNHDGTFQMNVDLNVSSVNPEDWRRYDCVFHLSGVEEDVIINLDQAKIRTNSVPPSEFPVASVVGLVVGLLFLAVCITGLIIWGKKTNGFRPANTSDS